MAKPQLEGGYIRISTELLVKIVQRITNSNWLRVLFVIIRITYGYNRKDVDTNYQAIATTCNMSKEGVIYTIEELKKAKVLETKEIRNRDGKAEHGKI